MPGKPFKKWLTRVGDLFAFAAGLAVVVLVLTTVVAVIGRYVFGQPIFGIEDISRVLLAFIVAGSIAYGAKHGAHVHVDVISMKAGRKVLFVTDVIARLVGVFVVFFTSYALFSKGLCGKACLHIPPGIEHACILSDGCSAARMLMIFQPSGFDQFLAALAQMKEADFEDSAKMKALEDKYDIINIGPVPDRPQPES